MPGKPWLESRVQVLLGLYRKGLSSSEIAAAMGISKGSALGKLQRLNVPGYTLQDSASRRKLKPQTQSPSLRQFSWEHSKSE